MSAGAPAVEAVSVVCFAAGGVRFAVEAGDVVWLGDYNPWAPALALALGLAPGDGSGEHSRTMTLAGPGRPVSVRVDGPVHVRRLTVDDVVRAPRRIPLAAAVVGFARIDGELVQLLEAAAVLAALPRNRDREDSRDAN